VSRVPRPRHFSALPPPPPPPPSSCHHPPHSTNRRHQPVSPASSDPLRYARCPVPPPLCSLTLPPAVYASAAAAAHRRCPRSRLHPPRQRAAAAGPCPRASSTPRYARCRRCRSCFPNPPQTTRVPPLVVRAPGIPVPGTTSAAAAPAAASTRRQSRHRPPPPTTPPGTCTTRYCLPSPPYRSRETSRPLEGDLAPLILISPSPPPGTEACHYYFNSLLSFGAANNFLINFFFFFLIFKNSV
jgi:hypothetical protein